MVDAGQLRLWHEARGLYWVPIRHHSPACARHLGQLIAEIRPHQVLIEAPADFARFLPLLNDAATRPPVAIVAFSGEVGKTKDVTRVSYFPFCSHSPEFVALRGAAAQNAQVRFIDLPSGHRMRLDE